MGEHVAPVVSEAPRAMDVDAEGEDDPTQPVINADGVDPFWANPWLF